MRLNEFIFDDHSLRAPLELRTILKSLKLLENNANEQVFDKFISDEKQYTIKENVLQLGYVCAPLYINSAPVGGMLIYYYTLALSTVTEITNKRISFIENNREFAYPVTSTTGEGRIDLLLFNNVQDLENFRLMLEIKFKHWHLVGNKQ